jgi:Tfp pilus assembly protein PilV
MKTCLAHQRASRAAHGGFSLVEIAVAVGLFAFGVVGVIGLFPAALAQRADAARDTRARIIAEQIFEALRGSNTDALLEDKKFVLPPFFQMDAESGDDGSEEGVLRRRGRYDYFPFCLGYGRTSTTPNRDIPKDDVWDTGASGEIAEASFYLARVRREGAGAPNLYKVDVQVGYPADLPADKRRNVTFTSLVYMK